MRKNGIVVGVIMAAVSALAGPALASTADVVDVKVSKQDDGRFRFDVTVHNPGETEERYADRWEIVWPAGSVLATRVLAHPHVAEQPFTRSLSDVALPDSVQEVIVRAHVNSDGFGGKEMIVKIPR